MDVHVTDDSKYRFSCHLCGKRYTQSGSLFTHMKNSHNGVQWLVQDGAVLDSNSIWRQTATFFQTGWWEIRIMASSDWFKMALINSISIWRRFIQIQNGDDQFKFKMAQIRFWFKMTLNLVHLFKMAADVDSLNVPNLLFYFLNIFIYQIFSTYLTATCDY